MSTYTVYRARNIKEINEFCKIVLSYRIYKRNGLIEDICRSGKEQTNVRIGEVKEIYLAYENETGIPVGCGVVSRYPQSRQVEFNVFVKRNHRRRGIGTRITKRARTESNVRLKIYRFDKANIALYDKFKRVSSFGNYNDTINPVKK